MVILVLGGGVGVDQDRVLVEHALIELIGDHEQVDHVLDRGVLDENGGFQIRPHIAVEYEIDLGSARNNFKNRFQIRIAKFKRNRLFEGSAQTIACLLERGGFLIQSPDHLQRAFVLRVFRQHTARDGARLVGLARFQYLLRIRHRLITPAIVANAFQTIARMPVAWIEFEHAAIGGFGLAILLRGARVTGFRQEMRDIELFLPQIIGLVFDIPDVFF